MKHEYGCEWNRAGEVRLDLWCDCCLVLTSIVHAAATNRHSFTEAVATLKYFSGPITLSPKAQRITFHLFEGQSQFSELVG